MKHPRSLSRGNQSITLIVWIAVSILPVIPIWSVLGTNLLSDNPLAYLVWIPGIALGWAVIRLTSMRSYPDDHELNILLGLGGIVIFGLLLALGDYRWPWAFSLFDIGILVWPFWCLSTAWMLFGVGATKTLIQPLAYMLLAWPPLYGRIVAVTMPFLNSVAVQTITVIDRAPFIRPTSQAGTFLVHSSHHWVPIFVSQVCSGADSLIAALLFLPVVLAFFKGPLVKKVAVLIGVALATILMNLVRLEVIIGLLHWTSPELALNIVHPVLGIVLLVLLMGAVLKVSEVVGLHLRMPQWSHGLPTPSRIAAPLATVAGAILWLALTGVGRGSGTPAHPITVSTVQLNHYLPAIPPLQRTNILRENEDTILGPGSQTQADVYYNASHTVMAEVWRTQEPIVLAGLGGRNCLLFHGNHILDQSPVSLFNGITGYAFVLVTPTASISTLGSEWVDMEYTVSTQTPHGRHWYFRVEIAMLLARNVHSLATSAAGAQSILHRLKTAGPRALAKPFAVVSDQVQHTFQSQP